MKKFEQLGKSLSKLEQKKIKGGDYGGYGMTVCTLCDEQTQHFMCTTEPDGWTCTDTGYKSIVCYQDYPYMGERFYSCP